MPPIKREEVGVWLIIVKESVVDLPTPMAGWLAVL